MQYLTRRRRVKGTVRKFSGIKRAKFTPQEDSAFGEMDATSLNLSQIWREILSEQRVGALINNATGELVRSDCAFIHVCASEVAASEGRQLSWEKAARPH